MKIIDRYLIREMIPPFLLALGLFTFLLAVKPMLDQAERLLVAGVDPPTIGLLLLTLLPQALGVTIPMAFMAGVLMALGRLSGDREAMAFLACGVSPLRLLRAILLLAVVAGGVDMYLLIKLVPDSNQRFREMTFRLVAQRGETGIKPGVFYEGFPGKVIHVRANRPGGGWHGVMLADTTEPGRPSLTLAPTGFLEIDRERQKVSIVLPGEYVRYVPGDDGVYDTSTSNDFRVNIDWEAVFGPGEILLTRGTSEMSIADLRRLEAEKVANGNSPHQEIIKRHQMFSFPVACLVFAVMGVALGLHTRKEGKFGGFTLGIGVILLYYALMTVFEDATKGSDFPAHWARWMPNIIVGLLALLALRLRMRNTGKERAVSLPAWLFRRRKRAEPSSAAGGPTATNARVVVVLRIPDIPLPRPRLLDRYVSRRYLNVSVLSFFGLLGLYYVGTLVDKSERLFKGEATTAMLVEYFYYSTPEFITFVAPMAILVSVLATIGGLTRTGELVVMRACGVSLYRVALPLVLLALVWSGGLFLLDDRVLAHANRRAEALEHEIKGDPSHTVNTIANANWLAGRDGRIFYYSAFDKNTDGQALYGLSVFDAVSDGSRLESHSWVSRAVFDRDAWLAERGWTVSFSDTQRSTREEFTARRMELAPPEHFSGMHNEEADLMTYGDLRRHLQELEVSGFNLADTRVQLAQRIAFPFVTIVMTLLGVPFGVTIGRRGTLYGVGLAIVLGASYWIINSFFIAVGQADLLAPALAAWGANLLFLALAVYGILTVRT